MTAKTIGKTRPAKGALREATIGSRAQRLDAVPPCKLYPYQERWVRDTARFKLAVKAAQIGYSFAAALEAVLDCLEHTTLWIVLSRSARQSDEFMQRVQLHVRAMRVAGTKFETSTFFDSVNVRQHEIKFPNGSRIIGLPANPDTARGYTGNMILDEFAFHQQDRAIWAAAFGRISRGGLKLRVLSTPNGQRGKYYELAREALRAGLCASLPMVATQGWSSHWCDVHTAVAEGCPIEVETLRQAVGDEQTWQQEYECSFLSGADNYIGLDLIAACEDQQATSALPAGWQSAGRELYFGYDVARVHDLAVLVLMERVGDVFWTRAVIEMPATKFSDQEKVLGDFVPLCVRGSLDATGMGSQMAERLAAAFPGKVEPVSFTAARKQEMAVRMKRHFEERTVRIPDLRPLRRDLNAVKRLVTSAGNIRFDAERTEAGHADRFWALALALHSAESAARGAAALGSMDSEPEWYAMGGDRDAEQGLWPQAIHARSEERYAGSGGYQWA